MSKRNDTEKYWDAFDLSVKKSLLNPAAGQKFKSVTLLWHLLQGGCFKVNNTTFRLGGDVLDLCVVESSHLRITGGTFRDFLRLSAELSDKDFVATLLRMKEEIDGLLKENASCQASQITSSQKTSK